MFTFLNISRKVAIISFGGSQKNAGEVGSARCWKKVVVQAEEDWHVTRPV